MEEEGGGLRVLQLHGVPVIIPAVMSSRCEEEEHENGARLRINAIILPVYIREWKIYKSKLISQPDTLSEARFKGIIEGVEVEV